jgi:perosamine synthetase
MQAPAADGPANRPSAALWKASGRFMISVYEPWVGEEEAEAVKQAIINGEFSGLFGKSLPAFEEQFSARIGCRHGIAVTSGTTALHLAVAALRLPAGSEVILSASTNIATALAVVHNNLVPVPIDSEPISWNLDTELIEKRITGKTRAIIPVHLFGHPARMDRIKQIADKHNLKVIEDCAESHGATWQGKTTGSWGDMGCFSFLANKIITTGEGGMVVTNDDALAEEMRLLRNMAFREPRFEHDQAGFNFRMTGYQAAFGLVQLSRFDEVLRRKRQVADWYGQYLKGIPGITLPADCGQGGHVYWVYGILVDRGMQRESITASLQSAGIGTRTFFCPMNLQPCFQEIPECSSVPCPVAEDLWRRGFYLPSGPNLIESQIEEIADLLAKAVGSAQV